MKRYFKYMLLIFLVVFSFYYTDRIIKFSSSNNTILTSINNYANENDTKCIEGSINEHGMILGLSGLKVDKNKSYSNMKGNGFNKELIEYEKEECILNKENNLDKYIISGNNKLNKVSLVIDIINQKYIKEFENIFNDNDLEINVMSNIDLKYKNILYKGDSKGLKSFKNNHDNFYCVKNSDYEIINDCKRLKLNSIRVINYIDRNLYSNTKKLLNKGSIIFIKESNINLNELEVTINYIKSRGYSIVNINELLS